MASIYLRGAILWMKFKNREGKPECRSTGYREGQEALARELAQEVERQAAAEREQPKAPAARRQQTAIAASRVLPMPSTALPLVAKQAATPVARIGEPATDGALTVTDYVDEWLKRRAGVSSVKDEEARLRLHVLPYIGHMAVNAVRPRHIRDLMNAIKAKTSTSPNCKGEPLAPRTVRHIYATVRLVFKSAVIDEHIAASPVVVESDVLPANVDKDPEWRPTAIFERDELVALVSDPRIIEYRRMIYALEGIAGVRHSEAAALRWRDYHPECRPLGKLIVARSGTKQRTKTKVTREVPVHPALAAILTAWRAIGWAEKYGREPTADDLIVPTEENRVRHPRNTLKDFHKDLTRVGFRIRRGHDLRRTFVTLTRADGGRADVLRPLTHPGEKDIIGLYTSWPWAVVCEELAKLRISLPGSAPTPSSGSTTPPNTPTTTSDKGEIVVEPSRAVAGYTPSYSPGCSPDIPSNSCILHAAAKMGEQFRKP